MPATALLASPTACCRARWMSSDSAAGATETEAIVACPCAGPTREWFRAGQVVVSRRSQLAVGASPKQSGRDFIIAHTMSSLTSVNITILGSASAQPSSTRNHSALALRLDGDVWLFDCGEATQHQIQKSAVRMGRIQKIFITHTHGDHIFGLLPVLAGRLNGAGGTIDGVDDPRTQASVGLPEDVQPLEIYGPLGTRAYVRHGLTYTHTLLGAPYVVHELRLPSDPQDGDHTALPPHPFERAGRNIAQTGGVWPEIFRGALVAVSAAPILHSVPCVGYVVDELPVPGKMDPKQYVPALRHTGTPMSAMSRLQRGESVTLADGTILQGPPRKPGRKIVILGDTYDPSPVVGLAEDACLLIHEATNAHLPGIDPHTKETDTYEVVEERAKSRGHSTPQMAGMFGKRIRARKLVLNHFSARYAGNDDVDEDARRVMDRIRELAESTFGGEVVCARDLMSFDVGPRKDD
ncbi:Metallo-hydrolase/oxidoreductase [Trametes gibbosa]|nr:Metallo-hydrolase/oxidoreductase [Trametes gibbosa]